ncbi:MAG: hypothetical protein PHP42_07810 [Bacteroidota bacterium]|nr:hypothetical protein [Bacteroidota bacterium]
MASEIWGADIDDQNNIWVVGLFSKLDSTGEFQPNSDSNYNMAKWDGNKWTLMRAIVKAAEFPKTNINQLRRIKVFSDSNIVVSIGPLVGFWNGTLWKSIELGTNELSIHDMYVKSKNDVYLVGQQGRILHWDGTKVETMQSNTKTRLGFIISDGKNLYASGSGNSGYLDTTTSVILYCENGQWKVVNEYNWLNYNPPPPNQYMGGIGSIFRKTEKSILWCMGADNGINVLYKITNLSPFHAEKIFRDERRVGLAYLQGNADNDIFVCGFVDGTIVHYNGSTWQYLNTGVQNRLTLDFKVNGNVFVTVGMTNGFYSRAIVAIGRR